MSSYCYRGTTRCEYSPPPNPPINVAVELGGKFLGVVKGLMFTKEILDSSKKKELSADFWFSTKLLSISIND